MKLCINDRSLEIRQYMFEILLYLVEVHAHVTSVSKELLERTLNALVEEIANEAGRCFQKVKKFSMGGMLRVRSNTQLIRLLRMFTPLRRPLRSSSSTKQCLDLSLRRRRRNSLRYTRAFQSRMSVAPATTCKVN